jgi:hypothetical protein
MNDFELFMDKVHGELVTIKVPFVLHYQRSTSTQQLNPTSEEELDEVLKMWHNMEKSKEETDGLVK